MQHHKFSDRSKRRLSEAHPDLARVMLRALELSPIDFGISEVARTVERQRELIDAGASLLKDPKRSRHVVAPNGHAHAVDVYAYIGGLARWDWPLYEKIATAVKQAAAELGVPIEWGGDWASFRDGPHFQLPWKEYPGTD